MDWIERFMSGVELRDPEEDAPTPVDFAVSSATQTLVLIAGWWRTEWGQGGPGIVVVNAPQDERGVFEGLSPGFILAGPTDEQAAAYLTEERLKADLDREVYLENLQRLREFEPGFDFDPWTEAILARPAVDTGGETDSREVGRIRLVVEENLRDTLLIDEHGHATTTLDGGWLSLFAEHWTGYSSEDRPDVGEFLDWLHSQDPHIPGGALETPSVFSSAGPLFNLERAPAP